MEIARQVLAAAARVAAPVAESPVFDVPSAERIATNLKLGLGKVVHDYLS